MKRYFLEVAKKQVNDWSWLILCEKINPVYYQFHIISFFKINLMLERIL